MARDIYVCNTFSTQEHTFSTQACRQKNLQIYSAYLGVRPISMIRSISSNMLKTQVGSAYFVGDISRNSKKEFDKKIQA